jgi:hypothetical protein
MVVYAEDVLVVLLFDMQIYHEDSLCVQETALSFIIESRSWQLVQVKGGLSACWV